MSRLSKSQLVENVASGFELTKKLSHEVVTDVFAQIRAELEKGSSVYIPELGVFKVGKRKARKYVNPTTKETLSSPAIKLVRFRAAAGLRRTLKGK